MRTALAAIALLVGVALAQVAVPELRTRVTDQTGTLTGEQRAVLEQRLAAFEQAKGSQVAVLIVPTTAPETIEQYSIRVVDQWRLGRKGVDDGVLLVVAKNDRSLRIEVGYGLEGVLPDALAKRIVAEIIVPYFQRGDFYGGIAAGVEQIMKTVQGEALPEPRGRGVAVVGERVHSFFSLGVIMLVIGSLFARPFGELPAAALSGTGFGLIGGLLLGSVVGGVLGGLILFLIGLAAFAGGRGGGRGGRGGWIGGYGGSMRGGSFGGGGGFSGGGGGFGGGGASGRW